MRIIWDSPTPSPPCTQSILYYFHILVGPSQYSDGLDHANHIFSKCTSSLTTLTTLTTWTTWTTWTAWTNWTAWTTLTTLTTLTTPQNICVEHPLCSQTSRFGHWHIGTNPTTMTLRTVIKKVSRMVALFSLAALILFSSTLTFSVPCMMKQRPTRI